MAAIYDADGTLNIEQLANQIREQLPAYARPQFIRILTKIDLTGNNTLLKVFVKFSCISILYRIPIKIVVIFKLNIM